MTRNLRPHSVERATEVMGLGWGCPCVWGPRGMSPELAPAAGACWWPQGGCRWLRGQAPEDTWQSALGRWKASRAPLSRGGTRPGWHLSRWSPSDTPVSAVTREQVPGSRRSGCAQKSPGWDTPGGRRPRQAEGCRLTLKTGCLTIVPRHLGETGRCPGSSASTP